MISTIPPKEMDFVIFEIHNGFFGRWRDKELDINNADEWEELERDAHQIQEKHDFVFTNDILSAYVNMIFRPRADKSITGIKPIENKDVTDAIAFIHNKRYKKEWSKMQLVTDNNWKALMDDASAASKEKGNNKFVNKLILAYLDEIERKERERGNA